MDFVGEPEICSDHLAIRFLIITNMKNILPLFLTSEFLHFPFREYSESCIQSSPSTHSCSLETFISRLKAKYKYGPQDSFSVISEIDEELTMMIEWSERFTFLLTNTVTAEIILYAS